MTRALAFLVRNWPLKLAAIILATLLYAGLVLSQNAQVWPGRVPIVPRNQPPSVFLLGSLGDVTNIRYLAPRDVAARLSRESFTAFVDLSDATAQPGSSFVTVNVEVRVTDPRVTVQDFDPRQIQVQLDPLVSKTVPVDVDRGTVPEGLEVRDPSVDVEEVTASGPQSFVSQVTSAVARVLIQPSGISVDQSVDLVAVDGRGEAVTQVNLDPAAVRVRILVGTQLGSKSLPVHPSIVGTPAVGYEIASVSVEPNVVSVEGEMGVLTELARVDTAPITVSGASDDVGETVALTLPDGVAALGESSVQVVVRIRAQTGTRDFNAGITPAGARADRRYELSTDRVVVTAGGPIADLDAIEGRTLAASVDVGDLEPGTNTVPVRVTLPRGLSAVAVSPARIEVTVSVPPTPTPTLSPTPSPAPSVP